VLEQVLRECQAQLRRLSSLGIDVRYVDTHMGWEWIHAPEGGPRASSLLASWCRREGLRWDGAQTWAALPTPPAGGTVRSRLLTQFERARPGLYIQHLHPCWPSAAIAGEDLGGGAGAIMRDRMDDAALAEDPGLAKELARRGVQLLRYDQLPLAP
jgi:hypothetical protein